ncbi:hypothetical protein ACFX1X_004945 [Malus domestica]
MAQYNHIIVMHLGGTNKWIIDTGATDQVTSDPRVFDELCDYVRDPYITSANGALSPVKGEGTISLTPTLSLVRALLVPDVKCNLFDSEFKCETCFMAKSHRASFSTPFDVLQKHVSLVSVSKLPPKVFGCIAYVYVYSHQRSKLDACALRCVFIGYANNKKGYKCYHPSTQKTYITMDVTFHEEVSYFVKPSSDSPLQGEMMSEVQIRRDGMDDVLQAELGT